MKKTIKHWLQGVAAGVCIGMGTITYNLITNKLLGAFIFAMGLFLVCTYKLKLCTGRAGYLINTDVSSEGFIVGTIGNINGITLMYILATLWNPIIKDISYNVVVSKFDQEIWQLFISAIFCGMLMFLAVDIYRHAKDTISNILAIFLAVPCFVLNGFDHCVVTSFHIHSVTNLKEVFYGLCILGVIMVGNFLGSILTNLLFEKANFWSIEK